MFQIPERSGFPSGALGAGAERFGFPSRVRGIPDVGWRNHWAESETLAEIKIAKTKMDRATLASSWRKADFEIRQFLHLKSEISKFRIGRSLPAQSNLQFRLSDLRCSIRPISKFLSLPYFARGFGRAWNFTIFCSDPLPPSWCQGVYIE